MAIAALRSAGAAAGLETTAVDDEAAAFVAAINASAPGGAQPWAAVFHRPAATFGNAVDRGRSWRDRPTPQLERVVATSPGQARQYATALVDLAAAAYGLGEPNLSALGVAGAAAAAQLRVVGGSVVDPNRPSSAIPAPGSRWWRGWWPASTGRSGC